VRFDVSTPVAPNEAAVSFSGGYSERDGYVTNPLTGHDLDWRKASFGKAQALWQLSKEWKARLIVSGERARDGDYRLNDLLEVRANPSVAPRNLEGFTNRDILAPTLQLNGNLGTINVASLTGFVTWKAADMTDLDYSVAPLIERSNAEKGKQFTEEIRFSSPEAAKEFRWQAGVFAFTQDYDQDAFNFFPSPVFLQFPVGTPAFRSTTQANLEDKGFGAFGQATFKVQDALSLSVGLRADFEKKEADLRTFTVPPGLGAVTNQNLSDDFSELSPHVAATYQFAPEEMGYASIARGYKAGGFNAASPAGTERFSKEFSWNYEIGYKASWLENRLRTNFAAFYSRWNDMQLNVPAATPGQFYVANAGAASSKGVEFEVAARPAAGWDVFAGGGRMLGEFRDGSRSNGINVSNNRLPYTPDYNINGGTQYTFAIDKGINAYVRGEVTAFGKFYYNDQNQRSQGAYALTNFRAGMRTRTWSIEAWVKNAFDENYVQIAIPFATAASGWVGEAGAPKTMGVSAGLRF
jgi:iron complex outermembrane receptor protein